MRDKGMSEDQVIGELQKNQSEVIRVQKTSYKGHDLIDMRVFYEDEFGEYKPKTRGNYYATCGRYRHSF